jgi:hypothetical protein
VGAGGGGGLEFTPNNEDAKPTVGNTTEHHQEEEPSQIEEMKRTPEVTIILAKTCKYNNAFHFSLLESLRQRL